MDFLLLRFATERAFPPSPGPPATPFPSGFALKRGTAEGEGSAGEAGGSRPAVPLTRARRSARDARSRAEPHGEGRAGGEGRSRSSGRDRAAIPAWRGWDSGMAGVCATPARGRNPVDAFPRPAAQRHGRERPGSRRCSSHGAGSAGCGENTWKRVAVEGKKAENKKEKRKQNFPFPRAGNIRQGLASRLMRPAVLGTSRQLRWVWGRGFDTPCAPPLPSQGPPAELERSRRMCHP